MKKTHYETSHHKKLFKTQEHPLTDGWRVLPSARDYH